MVNYENSAGGHSTANERGPEQESTLDAVRAALGELAIRATEELEQKTVTQGEILAKEFPGGNPQGLAKLKAEYIKLKKRYNDIGNTLGRYVGGVLHSDEQAKALICSMGLGDKLNPLFDERRALLEQMRELDGNVALGLVHCSAEAYVTEDGVQTKTTTYDQKVFPSLADATLTLNEDGLYVAEFLAQENARTLRSARILRYSITSDADGNIIGGVSINRENKN
jgi:hypothetical protein